MKIWLFALVLMAGCVTRHDDNPRNMQNMTSDQIERALAGAPR